ncbi:hypothetical protein HOY80DRAFT_955837 [Tuber brumale]|nr:hypothetical protein HOY80DRAFT_955837 [Tuber brumale]
MRQRELDSAAMAVAGVVVGCGVPHMMAPVMVLLSIFRGALTDPGVLSRGLVLWLFVFVAQQWNLFDWIIDPIDWFFSTPNY